jgi:mannose-6-phosphate isomerase-like protein (cupin superfamily)
MNIRTQEHHKLVTTGKDGLPNGYLVPIYNINDKFFAKGQEPKQVYLTVISPGARKGPHLHHLRTGFFTCVKGNITVVLKLRDHYVEYHSGENHDYLSIEVPPGTPALLLNSGEGEALVLNMPNPAWTPTMDDEHMADFNDYGSP